jgi:hypothetical protein
MRNILQLGSDDSTNESSNYIAPVFHAIVEDVVINEESKGPALKYDSARANLGEIAFRELPADRDSGPLALRTAFPLESNIQQYPLVGEIVLIYRSVGTLYYSRPINVSRRISDNVWQSMRSAATNTNVRADDTVEGRELIRRGVPVSPQLISEESTPEKITNNINVWHPRALEGDVIINGRFGSSVRLGSSLFPHSGARVSPPAPNLLITVGQWKTPEEIIGTNAQTMYFEDINQDKNSIWIVADQVVDFFASSQVSTGDNTHLRSSNITNKTVYDGAQIFINSDRVVLNSKKNPISLFSKSEINLSAVSGITLDTDADVTSHSGGSIRFTAENSIILRAPQIIMSTETDLSYKTKGTFSVQGQKIFVGRASDDSQPMVLGAQLSVWLGALITALRTVGGIQTTTGAAFLRPDVDGILSGLQDLLGKSPQEAMFNSEDNFVSQKNLV